MYNKTGTQLSSTQLFSKLIRMTCFFPNLFFLDWWAIRERSTRFFAADENQGRWEKWSVYLWSHWPNNGEKLPCPEARSHVQLCISPRQAFINAFPNTKNDPSPPVKYSSLFLYPRYFFLSEAFFQMRTFHFRTH